MRQNDYVIIMAGGIGSRFWPVSRTAFPKQFHDILGTGKTLIQMTYHRFAGFIPPENIFVVTNKRYQDLVKEQLVRVLVFPCEYGHHGRSCTDYHVTNPHIRPSPCSDAKSL